ncbi:hypothetical protein AMJ80_09300 [bacterium SM23_31]|nr:MAG: hypothetical protein AMJ80_09300 [bacterium SM23_31]
MIVIMTSVGSFLFMFGYFKGVVGGIINDSIKISGHLSIRHPEYNMKERMLSLSVPVEDYTRIKKIVESNPEIAVAAGRIKFGGLIDFHENNEPGLGMAFETELEQGILQLEQLIVEGRDFSGNSHETVIGVELASKLNIQTGDTITVITRTAYNSLSADNLIVVGIIDLLSSVLNRLFYLPLQTAQSLLDMEDQVTEIVVFLHDINDDNRVKNELLKNPEIGNKYSVSTWLDIGFLKYYLPMVKAAYVILIFLFGIIVAFGIINTMLMAVFERTREIGVMTAFGMKQRNVLIVFLFEALIIGCFGGVLGILIGGYWAHYLETTGITIGKMAEGFSMPIRQTIYGDMR